MNMKHEQTASDLERALKAKPEECNDPALLPFVQTAEALKREAASGEHLDREVAAKQRAHLISMANKHLSPESPAPSPEPRVPKSQLRDFFSGRWYVWTGGMAAVAAVVTLAVFLNYGPSDLRLSGLTGRTLPSISRLIIPEAHAADAFSMVVESQDRAGADTATSFIVSTDMDLSADKLKAYLRIVPPPEDQTAIVPTDFSVEKLDDGRFRVKPADELSPGKVYNLKLDAAVEKSDGSLVAREFSWAVQTKRIFRVVSSVPADQSSYVPTNTGIEFALSYEGWQDPAPYFSIEPKVEGRFEARGRSLVFAPLKPLAPGRIYTAKLAKGLKLEGSDVALDQDVVVAFETAPLRPGGETFKPSLVTMNDINVAAPGKDAYLPVYWSGGTRPSEVGVTAYNLSQEQARQFLVEYSKIPEFASETRKRGDLYKEYAKQKAFEAKGQLEEQDYSLFLRLPAGASAGWYILVLQPTDGETTYTFLESTNLATYAISDKQTTLVWAMNIETSRPLTDFPVRFSNIDVRTDRDGLARMPTPDEVLSTSTQASAIVTVGEGSLVSFLRLESQMANPWRYSRFFNPASNDLTVAYVYPDRPLYRTTDKLYAYGLAQDRASKQPAEKVTLELTRGGWFDWWTGETKVYKRIEIQTDDRGFFKASLDWNQLSPAYYTLSVKRDGITVATRNFEVRDFVKPAYSIDVAVSRPNVYAGEAIEGEAMVKFFDGTPVAGLEVRVEPVGWRAVNREAATRTLKTDADGRAKFSIPTSVWDCSRQECSGSEGVTVNVNPVAGEEAQIRGSAWATVWRSHIALEANAETKGGDTTLKFRVRRVELDRAANEMDGDVLGDPVTGAKVIGRIIERRWEKVETGTHYDFIEKIVVPTYRYGLREREVASIDLVTGSDGWVQMGFKPADDMSYVVQVSSKDDRGVDDYANAYFAKGWWSAWGDYGKGDDDSVVLEPTVPLQDRTGYRLGETVDLTLKRGGQPMRNLDNPNYLFVQSHLGLRASQVGKTPNYKFAFDESLVPNLKVRGIVFIGGGFIERETVVDYDNEERRLKITIEADQKSYVPGGKAKFRITAKDKDGGAAAGARLALGLVDEALYAAANDSSLEDPMSTIYSWVDDGVIYSKTSHYADKLEAARMMGGAEMGGFGGDVIRRNFKDTAAFETVTLDVNGSADIEISLPDNLTSWRATAVAITPDRSAGSERIKVPVSKPVFVDVVAPQYLLSQDKPVLKLRAFGTGLAAGSDVEYSVDAPTLGLKAEKIQGKADEATYVEPSSLPEGEHIMVIRVSNKGGSDAVEKRLTVAVSRFTRPELVQAELGPGVGLPDVGESREVEVIFLPKTRAQYLWRTQSLAQAWSQRLEARFAARLAQDLLRNNFGEKVETPTESLSRFQKTDGGLSPLPYSSSDAELTSKIALTDASPFDRASLIAYLADMMERKDISREEQIRAVSALAALHQPVLDQLRGLSEIPDLTWREKLSVIRGLDAAGDREAALAKLGDLLGLAQENDGQMQVRVAEDERSIVEATAEAAAIAASLAHPAAPKLDAWLDKNWHEDAMTDLDRIAFLARAVPAALGGDVTFGYTLGGSEEKVKLEAGQPERLTLTAEEAKNFRITQVDGPAVALFTRAVPAKPDQSRDLSLARRYSKEGGEPATDLKESDTVNVSLEPRWQATAPDGCYTVRDYLPAGLAPVIGMYWEMWHDKVWYPSEVDGNVVSFVVCKPGDASKPMTPITYKARVVSRGTYQAESAVMQSMDAPSVAALTEIQTVTIK
jgi:hypothetical protein